MMKEIIRCGWHGDDPLYRDYHDNEWGRVVTDDHRMFEFLTLESAQAGLSWITILRKRENYRKAFADFDAGRVAAFTDEDVERLLTTDSGIIRNRLKVRAAVTNAQRFIEVHASSVRSAPTCARSCREESRSSTNGRLSAKFRPRPRFRMLSPGI